MAEKSMGILGTTFASVAAAAFVGAGGTMFAYLLPGNEAAIALVAAAKSTWALLASTAAAVGRFFTAPVPLWAFLLLGAFSAWLWTRRIRVPSGLPELNDHHRALLELIAAADGRSIRHRIAAETLNLRQLVIDQLADELERHDLVSTFHGADGRVLHLSVTGRNYALQNSLMGDQALAERLIEIERSHKNAWMRH